MAERSQPRRRSGGCADRRGPGGALPAVLAGVLGAIAGTALTLSSGGGALLALLAYGFCGALGMMGFAALGALETPVIARLRSTSARGFTLDGFARRARVG